MNATTRPKLYSPRLLALSASLADYPLGRDLTFTAEERSRTCGSVISLGMELDAEARVSEIGLQVSACAVGQASAAVLAGGIVGKGVTDISNATDAIVAWLANEGSAPDWPGFDALDAAKAHKGRHGALLLAWAAAKAALSSTGRRR